MGPITMINTQHRGRQATSPFTASVCDEFFLSLSFAALYFPCLFPTIHRERYQSQLIYKLSDALTVQFHTVAGRYGDIVQYRYASTAVKFVVGR